MQLQGDQVLEETCYGQVACVNEAHERITHVDAPEAAIERKIARRYEERCSIGEDHHTLRSAPSFEALDPQE